MSISCVFTRTRGVYLAILSPVLDSKDRCWCPQLELCEAISLVAIAVQLINRKMEVCFYQV